MKYTFIDFLAEVVQTWNSKKNLLLRGIGSTLTAVALLIVIYYAPLPGVSKFDLFITKGFWALFSFCLFLFGIHQMCKSIISIKRL